MKRVDDFRPRFGKQEFVPVMIGGMGGWTFPPGLTDQNPCKIKIAIHMKNCWPAGVAKYLVRAMLSYRCRLC